MAIPFIDEFFEMMGDIEFMGDEIEDLTIEVEELSDEIDDWF